MRSINNTNLTEVNESVSAIWIYVKPQYKNSYLSSKQASLLKEESQFYCDMDPDEKRFVKHCDFSGEEFNPQDTIVKLHVTLR